jgi:hypothetical protein
MAWLVIISVFVLGEALELLSGFQGGCRREWLRDYQKYMLGASKIVIPVFN